MTKLIYDADIDGSALDGQTVAVIGYGSQGEAHARNSPTPRHRGLGLRPIRPRARASMPPRGHRRRLSAAKSNVSWCSGGPASPCCTTPDSAEPA